MTVWSMLEECVVHLDEPFRRSEIIGWFRRHHPDVNEATLAAHIQAATENAAHRAQNNPLGTRAPLLRRVEHGLYVRAGQHREHVVMSSSRVDVPVLARPEAVAADIVLVGCVRTKRPSARPAAELFASPLFEGRLLYAVGTGAPWYILSAKFGLLAPGDVIGPYDVYLADQSPAYRKAWGEFVVAELEQRHPDLHGLTIEAHAGAAYVEPLLVPLSSRGVKLATPLAHLRQGEQLAWYSSRARANLPGQPTLPATPSSVPVNELAHVLSDSAKALSPAELLARGSGGVQVSGLYSWWVDEEGAGHLAQGTGCPVTAGLIYCGQAGATRWPSGKRSTSTLWSRITGMHLGGSAEFSTFRRTLAAALAPVLAMTSEDDPQLSAWINAHLRVIPVPMPDADSLGPAEAAILEILDPPFNLQGRPATSIRIQLTELRRNRTTGIHPSSGATNFSSP